MLLDKEIIYLGVMRVETISADAVNVGDVLQRKKAAGSSLGAKVSSFNYVRFLYFKCFGEKKFLNLTGTFSFTNVEFNRKLRV